MYACLIYSFMNGYLIYLCFSKSICTMRSAVRPSQRSGREDDFHLLASMSPNAISIFSTSYPTSRFVPLVMVSMCQRMTNILVVDSMGYLEFGYLTSHAKGIITDSGNIAEEATFNNIPCITLNDYTETTQPSRWKIL